MNKRNYFMQGECWGLKMKIKNSQKLLLIFYLEARKSILKERKSTDMSTAKIDSPTVVDSQSKIDPPPKTPPTEITNNEENIDEMGLDCDQDPTLDSVDTKPSMDGIEQQKELWMDIDDFFESFK